MVIVTSNVIFFLGRFGSDVSFFGLQWPVLIGLSRRNQHPALHRWVTPSGKRDRARRRRRPHQLHAQRTIYTTDYTLLLQNAGKWLAPSFYLFAHANHGCGRSDMLGDLETSVNSLEQGSKNMLAQAKLLAAKQTAKSWMPKF